MRRDTLRLRQPAGLEATTIVKRCTRVSFECHTDVLMEDLLGGTEENFDRLELEELELRYSKMLFDLKNVCLQ